MMFGKRLSLCVLGLFLYCLLAGTCRAESDPDPSTEQFYSGNALYNRKLYALAIAEYKAFIQKHPQHPKVMEAKYGIALCYYSSEKYKEAEPYLKEVIGNGSVGDVNQLRLLDGLCLLRINNVAEAEKSFGLVVTSRAAEAIRLDAMAGLAESLFLQEKWDAVIAKSDALRKADTQAKYLVRSLYQGAVARHQLKKYADAIPLLVQLAEKIKGDSLEHETAYLLAECYRETGDIDKAVQQYGIALKGVSGAEAAEINYRIGFLLFVQKKYDEAITALDSSLKDAGADSKFVDQARICLGRAWLEKGEFNKAISYLGPHSGTTPPRERNRPLWNPLTPHAEAALWLARAYSRQQKYANASKVLAEAITKFPNDKLYPDLLYDHASALIVQGKYDEASKSLAALLPRDDWPLRNEILRMNAVCLHHAKSFEASLKATDEFLAKYPKDKLVSEVEFVRAENLYLLNRLPEALAAYRKFMLDYPENKNNKVARYRIAHALHIQEKWAAALEMALPLVGVVGDDKTFSQLRFLVGDCDFRTEQWEPAVSNLSVFVKNNAKNERVRRGNKTIIVLKSSEPNIDTALVQIAVGREHLGKQDEAIKALDTLIGSFPQSRHVALAFSERGRLHYEAKRYAAARQSFDQFLAAHVNAPQRPKVEYYFGWTCLGENKKDEAEKHFDVVVSKYGKDPLAEDAVLQLGLVRLASEKYVPARDTFTLLLQKYPSHEHAALAYFSRGVARARLKDWHNAAADFAVVAGTYPKSKVADKALYEWAWAEKSLKNKDQAAKMYEKLIAEYPESELHTKAKTELAELTFDAGDYDKVIAELQKTMAEIQDPALKEQCTYRLGTAYFNKKDYENSAKTFSEFVTAFPRSELACSAHFQIGEAKMQLKEMNTARDSFAKAAATDDSELKESALLRLGETQGLTHQWPQSAASYEQFLRMYPQSKWAARARFGLAWAYEKQKNYPRAMVEYRKIIALNKKDELSARSQFQIGECLFASKKYDEALQELVRVEVKYGYKEWSAKAALEMGRIMEEKGEKSAALSQFREIIKKYADDENITAVARNRIDVLRQQVK